MMFDSPARAMLVVFCLGQVLSGCGGEDTPDHLDFALPTFKFTVSSASQQWRTPPPGGIPNKVCAGPEAMSTDCCSSAFAYPPIDCQQYPVACNPDDNYCALVFDVEDSVDAVLATDVSQIAAVQGRVFSSVSLLSLTTMVSGMGQLPIRSANLYVAPGDSESASSPGAALLSPIRLTSDPNVIVPDSAAQQAFSNFAKNYQARFSLVLSAHFIIPGSFAPTGTVTFTANGKARAYY
jgi:hypothetical protein